MKARADWIVVLAECCEHSSQTAVARQLGVSASFVNQVLKGVYKGNLSRIEARVRGTLMRETLICPALGEITKRKCVDEQSRPFAATNPQRVAVYKACRGGCPHFRATTTPTAIKEV